MLRLIFITIVFCLFSVALASPKSNGDYRFLSLGDWGSVGKDQSGVAAAIGATAESFLPHFLLAAGDNFYEDGVANDTDPQWKTTYEEVYSAQSLQVPWVAILGNHDHHLGRGQGEIDFYLNKRDNRWFMPYYWYSVNFSFLDNNSNNVTVQIINIDTIILTGITMAKYGDINAKLGLRVGQNASEIHWQWLENELGNSTADWVFVHGHYPVYSAGEHGNTAPLVDRLLPLLNKYNVDIYLCGHDHTLQHLQDSPSSTQYYVSGNGAKRGTITPIKQSMFGVVDPGFMTHQIVGRSNLTTTMIDLNGKQIYSYTQNRLTKRYERFVSHQ